MTIPGCARAGIGLSGPVLPECVAPAGAPTDTADISCAVNGRKIDEEPKTGLAAVVRAAVVRGLRQQFICRLKCRRRRTANRLSRPRRRERTRSEEHTSELQSLMRISYAVFCLKKKKHNKR